MSILSINKRDSINSLFKNIFIIGLAFISTQRLTLPDINPYLCLIPFLVFLYYEISRTNHSDKIVFLIISIFISVDNGGNFYLETPAFIRYPIYASLLFHLISKTSFNLNRSFTFFIYISILILLTAFNYEIVSMNVLIRDLFILFLIFIVINQTRSSLSIYTINLKFLVTFLSYYLFFEVFNVIFFADMFYGEYLNYDSTKALVILPSLILFSEKKYLKFLFFGLITLYIFAWYGSRMITVIYLFALLLILLRNISFNKETLLMLPIVFGVIFLLSVYFFNIEFAQTPKIIYLIQDILVSTSVSDLLILLDPARYYEHIMFFDRNIFNILFGSGLGSGIYDYNDLLGFVSRTQTAFSNEELYTRIFYNFHDVHIDFGLRFGILSIAFVFYKLIYYFTNLSSNEKYFSPFLICLIFTMFFSTSGLLLITLFYIFLLTKIKSC